MVSMLTPVMIIIMIIHLICTLHTIHLKKSQSATGEATVNEKTLAKKSNLEVIGSAEKESLSPFSFFSSQLCNMRSLTERQHCYFCRYKLKSYI